MGSVAPGTYTLRLQSLGYSSHEETVTLVADQRSTVNVRMSASAIRIEGVAVEVGAEGAAIRDFGAQRITPTQTRRIPTPACALKASLLHPLSWAPGEPSGESLWWCHGFTNSTAA